ncbi:hypothetical protein [Yinghuangia seranimata]|uniref:hypothetical protein n=1 Tax=Yinghuangia seranimata TaxID=408067 RepID=UPI00248C0E06|nr:hypothetical protein [Yinghuangia seranimata]MDI2131102.1 hypothetical protein [Yinghuangia seranimata]
MEQVRKIIDDWRVRIEDHPLHQWLVEEDDVPPERKLWFSLYFTNFIMYFRELNIYHIAYQGDAGLDAPRAALTGHADEDMTHSRLFMADFKTLGWDDLLGWKPSEVFHWLFTSQVNEQLRRRTTAITKLYIEAQDPAVRYAVVEAVEACGNALFRHTTRLADRYTARTGRELIYWGQYHLERETGHAVEDEHETVFADMELTAQQRKDAVRLAVRAFELIDEQNSHMLQLAQETLSQGGFDLRRRAHAEPSRAVDAVEREGDYQPGAMWPEGYAFNFWPVDPHPTQRPLVEALRAETDRVAASGVLDFFRTDDLDEGEARLRLALLFMATDTTGTPTVYRHMVPYAFPATPAERAVNRMASRFGSRSKMLYVDWHSLGLDERLDWPVSRTLEFIYLDRATETHRDLRAVVTHHIDVTTDPLLRYWTVVALKKMTATYADAVGSLARSIEDKTGRPLPYLTLKRSPHDLVLEPDPEADAIRFDTWAAAPATVDAARATIEGIAGSIFTRYNRMLDSQRLRDYPEVA